MAVSLATSLISSVREHVDDRYIKPGLYVLVPPLNAVLVSILAISTFYQLPGDALDCLPIKSCSNISNVTNCDMEYIDIMKNYSVTMRLFVDGRCSLECQPFYRKYFTYILLLVSFIIIFLPNLPQKIYSPYRRMVDSFLTLVMECESSDGVVQLVSRVEETTNYSGGTKSDHFNKEQHEYILGLIYQILSESGSSGTTVIEETERFKVISLIDRCNKYVNMERHPLYQMWIAIVSILSVIFSVMYAATSIWWFSSHVGTDLICKSDFLSTNVPISYDYFICTDKNGHTFFILLCTFSMALIVKSQCILSWKFTSTI